MIYAHYGLDAQDILSTIGTDVLPAIPGVIRSFETPAQPAFPPTLYPGMPGYVAPATYVGGATTKALTSPLVMIGGALAIGGLIFFMMKRRKSKSLSGFGRHRSGRYRRRR